MPAPTVRGRYANLAQVPPEFGDALRDLLDPRLKGGVGRLGADSRAKSV